MRSADGGADIRLATCCTPNMEIAHGSVITDFVRSRISIRVPGPWCLVLGPFLVLSPWSVPGPWSLVDALRGGRRWPHRGDGLLRDFHGPVGGFLHDVDGRVDALLHDLHPRLDHPARIGGLEE